MHLIVAHTPDMERPDCPTAWTRLDTFHEFDEARIDRFIEAYVGIDHHKKIDRAPLLFITNVELVIASEAKQSLFTQSSA